MGKRRRWDRSRYPANWDDISWAFRSSKRFTCEHCGTEQGMLRISKAWNLYPARVMAAHRYPNDTANPYPELLCLCERCHFSYDARFRDILEEGEHQAVLHGILLERYQEQKGVMAMGQGYGRGGDEEEWGPLGLDVPCVGEGVERVCCSCGVRDDTIQYGCGFCGRSVHYQEPECGAWLFDCRHEVGEENEFWCVECWANSLL